MLVRVVRMHFTAAGAEEFLKVFQYNKQYIRNFSGCVHLELLKDVDDPATYITLSHWEDQSYLESYRKSELFAAVWKNVKPLFARRAEAFSMEQFIRL